MTIKEKSEELEKMILSPLARYSSGAKRDCPIDPCSIRTEFQRDRDRILHSKSFRRLKHKTQVFLSPEGDHYRTRLTHTLEVAQIARTVARALRLNEDLTEAIAMGHDLGHTAFGHAGETALNECYPKGFKHADQSVRVVEIIENLNLTTDVRNGIACHSSGREADTLEGRLVRFADKIAYMNHDIDDAIRAKLISEEDIPWDVKYLIGRSRTERVNSFVYSLINCSDDDIKMAPEILAAYHTLRDFLFSTIYKNPVAKGEESKAIEMLKILYRHFVEHSNLLADEYREIADREGIERAVCDFIAGMSDRYAVNVFEGIFVPRSWGF